MPQVIRQAIADRLRTLPELVRFLEDFRAATGIAVEFVGPLGQRGDTAGDDAVPALCAAIRSDPAGCRFCTTMVQDLLEKASTEPAARTCDAGLREHAVPLRAGGQTFGWLLFGRHFTAAPDETARNRIRHLLDRAGVSFAPDRLAELCARTPVVPPETQAALVRLLESAGRTLVASITEHLSPAGENTPPLIRRACAYAHRHYRQELSTREVARACGVSDAHFCRVFHQSTGLRFRDYVGRLRATHARELLESTDRPITDIAFDVGFQTVSQFNRVYRRVHGCAPRETRRAAG